MSQQPYPSEETWWPKFEQDCADAYAEANHITSPDSPPPNWSAFRWSARTGYDIAAGLTPEQSAGKHLAELRQALGLNPPLPTPTNDELVVRGQFFGLVNGTYWTAIQCSDFNLLNRYQSGENIEPILKQRASCGFNLLRVWTAYDIPGIGTFASINYGGIPSFVWLCAQYGLYVEFCAYTGINDPTHWDKLCDAARQCHPLPLIELVNELDQNTNEPDSEGRVFNLSDYEKPEGLLASHGSNGSEKWPVAPYWDYATFHTNGASEEQRKVGHNAWEIWGGPTLTNETSRYPEVGIWKSGDIYRQAQLAYDSAAGAALLCAGSCFHSVSGKTSELFDAEEEVVSFEWVKGARSVDLSYQDGSYRRVDDIPPDVLRIYQRVLTDGSFAQVSIRR